MSVMIFKFWLKDSRHWYSVTTVVHAYDQDFEPQSLDVSGTTSPGIR